MHRFEMDQIQKGMGVGMDARSVGAKFQVRAVRRYKHDQLNKKKYASVKRAVRMYKHGQINKIWMQVWGKNFR
jgi:hypothetical protein